MAVGPRKAPKPNAQTQQCRQKTERYLKSMPSFAANLRGCGFCHATLAREPGAKYAIGEEPR